MERIVVEHTQQGLWSVLRDKRTVSQHPTEGQALSVAFALAAKRRQAGAKMVVVVTQSSNGTRPGWP
jgi:hypothetical protein